MLEQACRYYLRALEVCSTDENLYFNLARAFVQGGRVGEAESALEKCLSINPGHEEGIKFKKYLCSLSLT